MAVASADSPSAGDRAGEYHERRDVNESSSGPAANMLVWAGSALLGMSLWREISRPPDAQKVDAPDRRFVDEVTAVEKALSQIGFLDDGQLSIPQELDRDSDVHPLLEKYKSISGVIDARAVLDCLVVVYNSDASTPDGFPDLWNKGRSGEYDPDKKIIYIDLKDSWSFLDEKYDPALLNWTPEHELRHHLVNAVDERLRERGLRQANRYDESVRDRTFLEQSYLDEVHSLFFESILFPGAERSTFRDLDSMLTTTAGTGDHLALSGAEAATSSGAESLFRHLQGLILLNEYSKGAVDPQERGTIENLVFRCGAILATARDIEQARAAISAEWEVAVQGRLKSDFHQYLTTNDFSKGYYLPVVTDDLLNSLRAGEAVDRSDLDPPMKWYKSDDPKKSEREGAEPVSALVNDMRNPADGFVPGIEGRPEGPGVGRMAGEPNGNGGIESMDALFKNPDAFADAIFDLVEKNPDDPSLRDVREWIAANGGREAYAGEALRAEIRDNGRLLMEQLSVEVMRSERGGSFNTPAGLADLALRSVAKSVVEAETGRKEAPARDKAVFEKDRDDVRENDARREDVFARIMEGLRERMEVGREVK